MTTVSSTNLPQENVPTVDPGERFELLETLGRGTFGAVYKVLDREHDQIAALKVLTGGYDIDQNVERRFREELRICSSITHINLVRAYDPTIVTVTTNGKTRQALAFTMEFIEGSTLLELLDAEIHKDKFSIHEIDRLMYQLLEGLHVLHQRRIVHRDIKLENIMLRADGIVKIADLGLLKRLDQQLGLTSAGVMLGTPNYMTPEYIKHLTYDERGDIYACGVVLYELLKKDRAFGADIDGHKLIQWRQERGFQLPQIQLSGPERKYAGILERSLAVEPAERYQSAKEMQADFKPKRLEDPDNLRLRSSVYFGSPEPLIPKKTRLFLTVALLVVTAFLSGLLISLRFLP